MNRMRTYVYGVKDNKTFLHTFLDERGALEYINKHKKLFPGRFDSYAMYHGDVLYKDNL